MPNAKFFEGINRGLLLSALYCATFITLWRLSLDQWYLPAGLRIAALLVLPLRRWPYVFLGDAAAVLLLRWPKVDNYSPEWAILPAMLLPPLLAVAPLMIRKLLNPWHATLRWLPLALAAAALWMGVWMLTFDQLLAGPKGAATLEKFLKFSTGYYLGMLMLVPAVLLWVRRDESAHTPPHLLRDSAIATGLVLALFVAVTVSVAMEPALKQFLLMLMIAPAVGLTVQHGWRGAAAGIVLVNIAIALAAPSVNFAGAHDQTTFIVQQALAVAATVLLFVGSIISAHFEHARRLGVAEDHALQIARASFMSTDRRLRDRVMVLAQIQARIEDSKNNLIQRLKAHGRYAAAMEVMRDAALHDELFEAHTSALYPISIDTLGLYDALQSPSFSAVWADQKPVRFCLRGQPKRLTVPLQVNAYRCACNAIALLSAGNPSRYRVRARAWKSGELCGIAVSVHCSGGAHGQRTQASTLAELEMEGRLKTHGGAMRRRRDDHVFFVLAETANAKGSDYYGASGLMDHVSPLAP